MDPRPNISSTAELAGRLRKPARPPLPPVRGTSMNELRPLPRQVPAPAPRVAVPQPQRWPTAADIRLPVGQNPSHRPIPARQPTPVLRRPVADETATPPPAKRDRRNKKALAIYAMAIVVFVVGLSVSLNGWHTNRQVAAQVAQLSRHSDDATAPPSTVKPTDNEIRGYSVAPNLPRYIDIKKLAVHARILSMGVTANNQLRAPGNVYDAGWYNASAQPGQPGAMLVDGHISSWQTRGVFYGLNKLVPGDSITITRGDGKAFDYTVAKTTVFDVDKVDMASLLVSQNTAKPGLNLISCSGDVMPGTNEFDKRIVIYAVAN